MSQKSTNNFTVTKFNVYIPEYTSYMSIHKSIDIDIEIESNGEIIKDDAVMVLHSDWVALRVDKKHEDLIKEAISQKLQEVGTIKTVTNLIANHIAKNLERKTS